MAKGMKKYAVSLGLILAMASTMVGGTVEEAHGEQMRKCNTTINVDGGKPVPVRIYDAAYTNKSYISIRDLCSALSGSAKQMDFSYDSRQMAYMFTTGKAYTPVGGENEQFEVTWAENPKRGADGLNYDVPVIYVNGERQDWRVYFKTTGNGEMYMKLTDLGLAFGLSLERKEDGTLTVDTSKEFTVDIQALEESGYFDIVGGALVGNADTGEIYYAHNKDVTLQLASTSKLMTYLMVQEAIDAGKLTLDTMVPITKEAVAEANSEDATDLFKSTFTEGKEVSVRDLLAGFLLPSANECGIALACAVSGSEAEFVKLMNTRAQELGLKSAKFYNPHGLPHYSTDAVVTQQENSMNVGDMFKLVSYIVRNYEEEITAFTSMETIQVPTVGTGAKVNSTYATMLRNMGCTGLKTGYTGHAGYCFVGLLPVEVNGQKQNVASLVYRTTSNLEKFEMSMMLLTYGKSCVGTSKGTGGKVAAAAGRGVIASKLPWRR